MLFKNICIYYSTVEFESWKVLEKENCSYIEHFQWKDENDLKPTESILGFLNFETSIELNNYKSKLELFKESKSNKTTKLFKKIFINPTKMKSLNCSS